MNSITTSSALRTQLQSLNLTSSLPIQQIRHATLIKRPKRPYTFTQLITLSDGSTFTQRTTSPQTVYLTVKDTKNSPLWNPSSQKLLNVEEDDAGRLRKFRERFGRGFDAEAKEVIIDDEMDAEAVAAAKKAKEDEEPVESLMDLISEAGLSAQQPVKAKAEPGFTGWVKKGKKSK